MVSSSSRDLDGDKGQLRREKDRKERPTSLWKRSRSFSPAPPSPVPESRAPQRAAAKPPSRSPIIRQSSQPNRPTTDISVPHALRRHSVYYNATPSQPTSAVSTPKIRYPNEDQYNHLRQSPDSVYDEPDEQEAWAEDVSPEQHLNVRQPRIQQRHSDDLANSDTAILALHSRLAAARDREALGIPPSASDACDAGQQRMSYMDSGSSLVRVGQSWEEGDRQGGGRDLSFGAEKLFRTLSGRTVDERGRDRSSYAFGQDDILKGHPADFGRPASIASQSSAGSIYEEDDDVEAEPYEISEQHLDSGQDAEEAATGSGDELASDAWRATIPPITYSAIADRRGPVEIQRQETIYALYMTEDTFVARLTSTINLFVLPLRLQDSRTYISGVPAEIAKLFDWLEDIRNLHSQLLSALHSVRDGQYPVVERIAEAIRESFVKELEVYQPYLARLVNVAGTIARLVADTTSDFGEFVRIQESAGECCGWSLESLLVDPVTRLGRYPVMFRKLYDHTPKTHADHIPTFALLHSTELVIKVMSEVKIREDEYDLVKNMSSRIKGLPPAIQLAKRGRRLLFQGQLLRVQADPHSVADVSPMTQAPPFNDRRKSVRPDPKRSTQLADAIQSWDQRRSRSGSNVSSGTTTSAS
ncbi:Dbl homology domain-containing protein, partial [Roridomyces roridus]